MMQKQHLTKVRIFDGLVGLGRSCIDAATLTMDGKALPATLSLDARSGNVSWVEQGELGAPGPYTFEFEHFTFAEVCVSADKGQITADGVEQVTLTAQCEDLDETVVKLAVYCDGEKIGTFDVAVANGQGSASKTIAVSGTYEYRADPDTLDSTWNVAKFADAGAAIVEAV